MASSGRLIRVFISSTFNDFVAERDALQEHVFPFLRQYCRERGITFQAIDLRWGISQELSQDQRTVGICLEEIERCQTLSPEFSFFVLLGDRYGSQLPPTSIPQEDFKRLHEAISAKRRQTLDRWYWLDENAVDEKADHAYVLMPRRGDDAVEGGRFTRYNAWKIEQKRLIAVLNQGVTRARLSAEAERSDETDFAIRASVTAQEIKEGIPSQTGNDHALCFIRDFTLWSFPSGKFRESHSQASTDLATLKISLAKRVRTQHYPLTVRWNSVKRKDLNSFCDQVRDAMLARIDAIFQGKPGDISTDAPGQVSESEEVQRFEREHLEHFRPREAAEKHIQEYLTGTADTPLVLTGASGIGKTTLLVRTVETTTKILPDAIIKRYIGGVSGIGTTSALLQSILAEVITKYAPSNRTIPTTLDDLIAQFPSFLALATAERPLILIVDALDQLQDSPNITRWLPNTLPAHVHVIVSLLPGAAMTQSQNRYNVTQIVTLEKLSREDGQTLLLDWMTEDHRSFQEEQLSFLSESFAPEGLPLHLRLLYLEARRWHSWQVGSRSPRVGAGVPGVLQTYFDRIESEYGKELVTLALGFIGAARNGMAEEELLEIISTQEATLQAILARMPDSPKVTRLPDCALGAALCGAYPLSGGAQSGWHAAHDVLSPSDPG